MGVSNRDEAWVSEANTTSDAIHKTVKATAVPRVRIDGLIAVDVGGCVNAEAPGSNFVSKAYVDPAKAVGLDDDRACSDSEADIDSVEEEDASPDGGTLVGT